MPKTLQKVDVKKSHKHLYHATQTVQEVRAARATFLAVDDVGEPGGTTFQAAIGKLFSLAYTAKFMLVKAGVIDFAVPNLECLWFDDPAGKPKSQWRWRLMLRIPDQVTGRHLAQARAILQEKKDLDASAVRRISWTEGRALQVLHVGPYEKLGTSYERLTSAAAELGMQCAGTGHDVYLSDPRRVAPEKLKTIVRMAVKRASARQR